MVILCIASVMIAGTRVSEEAVTVRRSIIRSPTFENSRSELIAGSGLIIDPGI